MLLIWYREKNIMSMLSESDYSITNQFKRLVSQYVKSAYKKQAIKRGKFSKKDKWINSIVEYAATSLPSSKAFSTTTDVDSILNAGAPKVITNEFKISLVQIINQSISLEKLYASWTTEATKQAYIKSIADGIISAIDEEENRVLITATLQGTGKIISYDFDNDSTDAVLKFDTKAIKIGAVDETENQRVKRVLNWLRNFAISLKTPSVKWTKLGRVEYLADNSVRFMFNINSISQLVMIVNAHFAAKMADLTANLFNKGDVLPLISQEVIDFSLYGYTKIESDKIDFILCSIDTFKEGSFIEDVKLSLSTFDFKTVLQNLYSIGFAKLPNYPAYIWKKSA